MVEIEAYRCPTCNSILSVWDFGGPYSRYEWSNLPSDWKTNSKGFTCEPCSSGRFERTSRVGDRKIGFYFLVYKGGEMVYHYLSSEWIILDKNILKGVTISRKGSLIGGGMHPQCCLK